MHRLLLLRAPRRSWAPRLRPLWVRLLRPFRQVWQRRRFQLRQIEVRGIDHLRRAIADNQGVLIAPNHFSYADPFVLLEASDRVRLPFYFLTAWQVFESSCALARLVMRQHGCVSVDREGADVRAFRQAVDILRERPNPLVIFPEGEMYHIGGRVLPFHEGAASVALTAARSRPVVCLPASLEYRFVENPRPELERLTARLERAIFGRSRVGQTLAQRVDHLAEASLAQKEIEHFGEAGNGPLRKRIERLCDGILRRLEWDHDAERRESAIPTRVHRLRQRIVARISGLKMNDTRHPQYQSDLDDLFSVLQTFCYPAKELAEGTDIESVSAALDHLEEEILGVSVAAPRAACAAVLTFGEPARIEPGVTGKVYTRALTRTLEQRVQALLDGVSDATAKRPTATGNELHDYPSRSRPRFRDRRDLPVARDGTGSAAR